MDNNQEQEQEQIYVQTDADQTAETPQPEQEQPSGQQQTFADNPKSILLMGGLLLGIIVIGVIYFFSMGRMGATFVAAEPTEAQKQAADPTITTATDPTSPAAATEIPENPGNINRKHHLLQLQEAIIKYQKAAGSLPTQITNTPQMIAKEGANLCPILVPAYLPSLPKDPITEEDPTKPIGTIKDCNSLYVTGYIISKTPEGRVTITAPYAEDSTIITVKF